jgi:hypothetical protein
MKQYLIKFLDFLGLKAIAKNKIIFFKLKFSQLFYNIFNKTVIRQNKNYKSIPIIIISFNQLFYLKQLIDFLKKYDYNNIVIIDNNSTYPPLLNYFSEIELSVTLYRLKENYGHLVFWKNKELFNKYSNGYYVVTDADIIPVAECPVNFLSYFKKKLDENYKITKAGFSLKIDDIPESNFNKDKIINWESKFYESKDKDGDFLADIDTTFAIYRPRYKHQMHNFYNASRIQFPYIARHGGWYVDNNDLTEEQDFYFKSCNASSSWRIDEQGNVKKNLYNKC